MKNFNYFYSGLSLPTSQWAIYYDFSEGANPIQSQPSANSLYSGVISNTGNFYSISGSGLFTGANIQIQNASGLSATNFTMFLVYDRRNYNNGVLFSSLQSGGANVSGFIVGVNDANRLYFESYDNTGPLVYTSSNIYGAKNAVAVVKSNNILRFEYFNFNTEEIEAEQFTISSNALYQSNQAYIGSAVGAPSYITQNNFTGYMDQFIYINNALTPNIVTDLFSGFYALKNANTLLVQGTTNNFITGAAVSLTGLSTGVTGYQIYLSGYVYDNCGDALPVYGWNNMTGTFYEDVFVPLYSPTVYTVTGIQDNGFYIDTGYCNSFGMDGVTYIQNPTGGFSEIYNYNLLGITGSNLIANYNLNGTFLLNGFYNNSGIELYVNGLSKFPSGYYISGNGYTSSVYPLGDFYVSGQFIVSTGFFGQTLTYDTATGGKDIFYVYGSTPATFILTYNNSLFFNNGYKLVSGLNYVTIADLLHINTTGLSGIITSAPMMTGFNYYSGTIANIKIPRFSRDTTEVWLQGVKQMINVDYIETSSVDFLNNSGIFDIIRGNLYNNIDMFQETW